MENSRYTINVRLRKKDVDLIQWYESIPETEDRSRVVRELIREGLKNRGTIITGLPALSSIPNIQSDNNCDVTEESVDDLMSRF